MKIDIYVGRDAQIYQDSLALARIESFKQYPYLYSGTLERSQKYAARYAACEQGMIAVAMIQNKVACISTGIPLSHDSNLVTTIRNECVQKQLEANQYYYLGETIVMPEFQSQSVLEKIVLKQCEQIKAWGFEFACMLNVLREDNHPLKPVDYQCEQFIWQSIGFSKTDIVIKSSWPTIQKNGEIEKQENLLGLWVKDL